jgi:hypothetical protein
MDTIIGRRFEGARLVVSGVRLERYVLDPVTAKLCILATEGRAREAASIRPDF